MSEPGLLVNFPDSFKRSLKKQFFGVKVDERIENTLVFFSEISKGIFIDLYFRKITEFFVCFLMSFRMQDATRYLQ